MANSRGVSGKGRRGRHGPGGGRTGRAPDAQRRAPSGSSVRAYAAPAGIAHASAGAREGSIAAMSAAAAAIAAAPITAASLRTVAAALFMPLRRRWPMRRCRLRAGASICGRAAVRCAWAAPDCRDRVPAAACGAAAPVREPAAAPGPAGEAAPRGPAAARRARSGAGRGRRVLVRTRRGAGAAKPESLWRSPRGPAPGLGPPSGREPAPGPGRVHEGARRAPWLCSKNCPRSAPAERAKCCAAVGGCGLRCARRPRAGRPCAGCRSDRRCS